nr:PREDICTED: uncharacterized protein LOC103281272 isoform X1 [Anolis carolinensis]|eukprot:XP_008120710.1 PREDICTED: uncharacterized protein LOC103281272 isoform X1 [Anolis carolinensis]
MELDHPSSSSPFLAQISISCFFVAHSQDPTTVNITVVLLPEYPKVGGSVTIIPGTTKRDVTSCLWLKNFEDGYHRIILNEFKPNNKVTKGDKYDGRQFLREHCALLITKLDIEDQASYKIIKNTTSETETGETFLRILGDMDTSGPHKPQQRVITVGTMAGIIVGCLIGSVLIVGLITYQTMKQSERNSWGSGEGRSPHSSSKPGSQQRLSIHNLGPVPAPQ